MKVEVKHPVVFHRDVAQALNKICGDVREKWIIGECDDIRAIAMEVVSKTPSWSKHVLQLVFEDTESVVRYVVNQLYQESRRMRVPSQQGRAVICFRLASGYAIETLTQMTGFPETTLQEIADLHAAFVTHLKEQMQSGEAEPNKLWNSLDTLWAAWIEGTLIVHSHQPEGETVEHSDTST